MPFSNRRRNVGVPESDSLIQFDSISVRYRAARRQVVHAVEQFSLEIRPGERIGLVGESGCGKSTVARCALGLVKPKAGSILFRGENIWDWDNRNRRKRLAREVGIVFQDPTSSLNPRLSVLHTLLDPLQIHSVGSKQDRQKRASELMELVGLSQDALNLLPSQLSGGQKQRVAIARAIALNPSVLIADEPISALDVSIQNQILNLLLDLRDQLGLAILFISHNLQAVSYFVDRIVVMYLGRRVEEGSTKTIQHQSSHPYTRALLSASPMITEELDRIVLEGAVPSARQPPKGCPFQTRCWKVSEQCRSSFPHEVSRHAEHVAYCFHPE